MKSISRVAWLVLACVAPITGCRKLLQKAEAPAEKTAPATPPTAAAPSAPASPPQPQAGGPVTPRTEIPNEARILSSAFSAVAKALRPSVVRIDVEISQLPTRGGRTGGGGQDGPPFFHHFFDFGGGDESPDQTQRGTGSGVVLDAAGNIVTNRHVVSGATTTTVIFSDGREFSARTIGMDSETDVAVIRLDKPPQDLIAARLGDSDALEVGEWVLAVGSPLGLDQTITAGIISGRPRIDDGGSSARRGYLLTDAKVNPGDSGGPLVDLTGQVVGLTTLISAGPGGSYAYAVPINRVRRVAVALIRDGHAEHPYIGVGLRDPRDLQPAELQALGAGPPHGALVSRVWRDTPAGRAGLRRGDVITSVNNRDVPGPADLVELIDEQQVGAQVSIGFVRDGASRTALLLVADLPPPPLTSAGSASAATPGTAVTTVSSPSDQGGSPIEFQ